MKGCHIRDTTGFTLGEMLLALAIASLMLAATVVGSVSLQKSLNAVGNYFDTLAPQIRIIDLLSRDVKRSYIVGTSPDYKTVTCTIPDYLVQAGDPDATGSNIGTRRSPKLFKNANGISVSYQARMVTDASITSGSATLSVSLLDALLGGGFTSADVGQSAAGNGIPAGTKIQSVTNSTTATMSNSATLTLTNNTVTVGSLTTVVYAINTTTQPQSITRTENGTLTATIGASADNLIPLTTDVELSNTEYAQSTVTFLPVFTSGNPTNGRAGTTMFSLSYLRNRRRGDQ
jgi:Tfp pilus assembly protein FimT